MTETALGAAAAGARAARAVNADLIAEEARHAAETRPVPFSAEAERGVSEGVQKRRLHNRYAADQEMSGQQWWDARYSGSTRVWSGLAEHDPFQGGPGADPRHRARPGVR
ncbi:hypothetical protein ACFSTC_26980 [Nonomuraea ferruginea]